MQISLAQWQWEWPGAFSPMEESFLPLSHVEKGILEVLKRSPDGLDIEQIRAELHGCGTQQHLDRRVRALDPFFLIKRSRVGKRVVYKLEGAREAGDWAFNEVSKTDRAAILDRAKGRCQMCGRSVAEDGIILHIDHKIPQSWGGESNRENLWALCSTCNEGKRNYYATFSEEMMKSVLACQGVHNRIAELLKLNEGKWVVSDLIEFVSNFNDFQDDWQKRLRELRYLGFEIEAGRMRIGARHVSRYRLTKAAEIQGDLGLLAKRYERNRR